jgi:hypothetical protein
MGMIWNSQATLDMIKQVNTEFSGDPTLSTVHDRANWSPPISYWQQAIVRDDFNSTTKKGLTDIAQENGVQSPTENGNWMTWLSNLGDYTNGNSQHEKLRAAIYKGLNGNKYSEIVFSVLPLPDKSHVKVTTNEVNGSLVITVHTPTYNQILQSVRKAAKKRAAKKKAAKKKKP